MATFGDAITQCANDESLCATRVQIYEEVDKNQPMMTRVGLYEGKLVIESVKVKPGCGCHLGTFQDDILFTEDVLADDWTVQPKEESD